MNKLLIVFLGVGLMPTLAVGQFTAEATGTATPTKMTTTQQEVQAAVDQVTKAIKTKDKALYERYVAPDYIHTNPAGEVTSREKEFSDMTSGVQTFASIKLIPLPYDQIRIFNDNTALITAHYNVTGNDHGKEFTMQTRSLATWVKRNGAWQMVAFQATGVAKPFQK
jgi:uncharacterized protein (TIGR02246 family)